MKIKYLIALVLINIFCLQNLFSQTYTYNIKIAAHIVRSSQGLYGIDTADLTTSIQQVNTVYTTYNNSDIHFELAYYDYIDSETYTTGELINFNPTNYIFQQKLQNLFNEKNNVGVIHVYFIKKSFTTTDYAGVAEDIPGYKIVVTNEDALNGETVAHEIGHCLGLLHTYEGIKFNIHPTNGKFWSDTGIPNQPEWVARQGYPCSNSTTNGDLLNDTPADPIYDEGEIAKFIQNCNFYNDDNIRDNSSCRNLYAGVLINNIMAFPAGCSRWQFTNGQIDRMKAFLNDRLKSINNTMSVALSNKFNGSLIPNEINKPSTLSIDGFNYNSGGTAYLNPVSHSGKTNQERFVNYQSNNIKHNNWNSNASEYHLAENFTPVVVSPFRDASFLKMNYSKVEARLEESFISGKGDFQFQDPWYALSDNSQPENHWTSASGMYEPTGKEGATEKGVFLNQEIAPNKPYYSVKTTSPQPISLNGRTHNFYFQNWGGTNVDYDHADQLQTGVVFTDLNAVAYASMKGTQLSNDQTTYANNSQRKFVRTPDGYYHQVYQSMDRVWYEMSTNNGSTWSIMNSGKPLSSNQSKLPSIDYYGNVVAIVWQQINGSGYDIKLSTFYQYSGQYILGNNAVTVYNEQNESYSNVANPVIGWSYNGKVMIVWEGKYSGPFGLEDGLHCKYGSLSYNGVTWYSDSGLPSTNGSSIHPTIQSLKESNDYIHKLAWEQTINSTESKIYYYQIYTDGNDNILTTTLKEPSYNSGYPQNSNPSILATTDGARLCWIGRRINEEDPEEYEESEEVRTIFRDAASTGQFWNFGDAVTSVNINRANPIYSIAWGRGNSLSVQYADSRTLRDIYTISGLTGVDIQVCNAAEDRTKMRVMTFNNQGQPYYFNNDKLYLSKPTLVNIASGREGVVGKDSAQFYFAMGDIMLNGQPVNFVEFDDTVSFYSNQRLNEFLLSEPFCLTDNSDFTYSVQYGITDSSAAVYVLDNDDFVNFKVELRDDQTGELLGLFDNITYTKANVAQYDNIAYQVNTQGIGNRTVRLRLVTDNNFDPKYSLTDRYAEGNALLKGSFKQVGFQGSLAVDNYDLSQNYPNPFNPTTTINYQIKEDGLVTLKLYDILGAEVKTLVNEEKTKGRYTHNFNGSDLASGVYIYQLRVNDFVSSKKIMLLK